MSSLHHRARRSRLSGTASYQVLVFAQRRTEQRQSATIVYASHKHYRNYRFEGRGHVSAITLFAFLSSKQESTDELDT